MEMGDREARPPGEPPVVAVVKDLFFGSRIRETARVVAVPIEVVKTPEALETALARPIRLAIVDLTAGFDYERIFGALRAHEVPAVGFTTHVLASETRPWHARCARAVTKETLTRELATFLRDGVSPLAAPASEP